MSGTQTYILREERDRRFAIVAVQRAPLGMAVEIKKPKRSTEQNRRLWAMLSAIAGDPDSNSAPRWAGRTWDTEDWKDILLHAYLTDKRPERAGTMVPGLNGGVVVLGRVGTSDLTTEQFSEFMDMIVAWMDQHSPPIIWAEQEQPPPREDDR